MFKDLTETTVAIALSLGLIALTYSILTSTLTGFIESAFSHML